MGGREIYRCWAMRPLMVQGFPGMLRVSLPMPDPIHPIQFSSSSSRLKPESVMVNIMSSVTSMCPCALKD
jgi:hypothetical protein